MTKPDIIAKLIELKVPHDANASALVLSGLLRRTLAKGGASTHMPPPPDGNNTQPPAPDAPKPPEPPAREVITLPPGTEMQSGPTVGGYVPEFQALSATVHDPNGRPHRTFSLDVHGEDFRKLADTYVSSRPGWTVR